MAASQVDLGEAWMSSKLLPHITPAAERPHPHTPVGASDPARIEPSPELNCKEKPRAWKKKTIGGQQKER